MKKIADSIFYKEKCFNCDGIPNNKVSGKDILLGALILKVVIDFIHFEKHESTIEKAFSRLEMQKQFYVLTILIAFNTALNLFVEIPKIVANFTNLREGMLLNKRILTKREKLIARKRQKVSVTLLQIISHCLENKAIEGTVEVKLLSGCE